MTTEATVDALMARHGLPGSFRRTLDVFCRPLAGDIAQAHAALDRSMVVGVCGSQGSGKSTLVAFVEALLRDRGLTAAVLSLDDLYLTRAERARLAVEAHPLFLTRGVPGTHDVELGLGVLDDLTRPAAPRTVALPRFDKAVDDRTPRAEWPTVEAPVDVVLLEGWCVGARSEAAAALDRPVNALERERDADGRWRRRVNARLADGYQRLFARIDLLVFLQAPDFDQVFAWRGLQEAKLAAAGVSPGGGRARIMDDETLGTFIMHYERLTRHMLAEMPGRADVVVRLGRDHAVEAVTFKSRPGATGDERTQAQAP